jgi:SAM-dependent methyltransferase
MIIRDKDEFDWYTYTRDYYEKQMTTSPFRHILKNFSIIDGELSFHGNVCPNHAEIYNQVYSLGVKSVYECGFGGGQHLMNIYEIMRERGVDIEIGGCDISEEMIDMGMRLFNLDKYGFLGNLQIKDFSIPLLPDEVVKYDFVYAHAVTMHLSLANCRRFLENMKLISNKYVFLVENFAAHDYDGIIKEVFPNYTKTITYKYIPYGVLLTKK